MTRIERFTQYLASTGFDYSPLAWHLSGLPLNDEQHTDVAALLGSDVNGGQ